MTVIGAEQMRNAGALLRSLVLGLSLALVPGTAALAQDTGDAGEAARSEIATPAAPDNTATKPKKSISITPNDSANAPDYPAWERLANRAEAVIADRDADPVTLTELRGQLVDWRAAFLVAQSTNSTRIQSLRSQIDALGALPAEGENEPIDIAERRKKLTDQLVRLQAPGIEAEEAYTRADGLIKEIDRIERERQADELLKLWPSPANPANWPQAMADAQSVIARYWDETRVRWQLKGPREELVDNLPLVLILLAVGIGLMWRGRRWIDTRLERWHENASIRGREVWTLLASVAQIIVPTAGVFLLSMALAATGMLGRKGQVLIVMLPMFGFVIFFARWLGLRLFPRSESSPSVLRLTAPRRAEGRLLSILGAFIVVVAGIQEVLKDDAEISEAAMAVWLAPVLIAGGFLLFRFGRLLRAHVVNDTAPDEPANYRDVLVGFIGRSAMVIGVVGPVLALIGYVAAAEAMVLPGLVSLAFIGVILIFQRLLVDLYTLYLGDEEAARQALVPTLANLLFTLMTLPVFALIWGARWADLTELWTRFREGFQLGSTRISPTDFLYFAILFAIGYMLTRLFQGALKTSILPKTRMDQGGQNAVTSGVGYIGIFLSALVAINSAGIDLSGLAIVAGALSVGIGFGLQNIVSNFVSGIILLIERPVSEGDWIEVGGVQGVVKSISVRSTRIQTFDRSDVIVPNSDLVSGRVTNMTRFNLTGRLIVAVGVDYGSDTRKVSDVLREVAEAHPMVVLEPPPVVAFMGFGADSLNFEIRAILRDVNFSVTVRSEINHEIARRFAEEGIAMPFSQRDVWFRNPEAIAEAFAALSRNRGAAADGAGAETGPTAPPAPPGLAPQQKVAPNPQPVPRILQDRGDATGEPWARGDEDDDGDTR